MDIPGFRFDPATNRYFAETDAAGFLPARPQRPQTPPVDPLPETPLLRVLVQSQVGPRRLLPSALLASRLRFAQEPHSVHVLSHDHCDCPCIISDGDVRDLVLRGKDELFVATTLGAYRADLSSRRPVATQVCSTHGPTQAVAPHPSVAHLMATASLESICIANMARNIQEFHMLEGAQEVQWSPTNNRVLAVGKQGGVVSLDVETAPRASLDRVGRGPFRISLGRGLAMDMLFADKHVLAVACRDGPVRFYDLRALQHRKGGHVPCLKLASPDARGGMRICLTDMHPVSLVQATITGFFAWDLRQSHAPLHLFEGSAPHNDGLYSLGIGLGLDGDIVYGGGQISKLRAWRMSSPRLVGEITWPRRDNDDIARAILALPGSGLLFGTSTRLYSSHTNTGLFSPQPGWRLRGWPADV